jgi:hypothetical protein
MLKSILFGFGVLANIATLVGLWITYISAPATIQNHVGHILLVTGALCSISLYLLLARSVLRPANSHVISDTSDNTSINTYIWPRWKAAISAFWHYSEGSNDDLTLPDYRPIVVPIRYGKIQSGPEAGHTGIALTNNGEPAYSISPPGYVHSGARYEQTHPN